MTACVPSPPHCGRAAEPWTNRLGLRRDRGRLLLGLGFGHVMADSAADDSARDAMVLGRDRGADSAARDVALGERALCGQQDGRRSDDDKK